MGILLELRRRAAAINAGFTAGQRTVVVIALVALVGGGLVFVRWASSPSYSPLFSNLEPADAAAITEKLTADKVPYELADGGRTILVPADEVYQRRLDASAAGLPAGGSGGYTLLDKQGVTTSEFRQRIDFQRAMEGELVKTIESIEGVESASVHLVIPPEDVFADSDQKPSASVLVKNKIGATLSPDQVRAVSHLVASSIQGLDPSQITIADAKGSVLLAPGQDGALDAAGDVRTRQVREFEQARAKELQDMLDRVVGPGRAVVRVNADLDFDKRTTKSETFARGNAPVLAESTSRETYQGSQQGATGILGTDTPGAGTGNDNAYGKQDTRRDYGVDRTTEETQSAPGRVNRLSVAVLLDGDATVNPADLEQAIAAASGIDPRRGDVIEVTRVPFDDSVAKATERELDQAAADKRRAELVALARTVGLALLILVVLFLAWRAMRKAARAEVTTSIDLAELERERAVLTRTDVEGQAPAPAELPEPKSRELEAEERKRMAVEHEVGELIQRQPEEVARLLRGWLADRRS